MEEPYGRDSAGGAAGLDDSLLAGPITRQRAQALAATHPAVMTDLAEWTRQAIRERDWRRVEKLANLAAPLRAPGVAAVLRELLDADIREVNNEDLVEILGELGAAEAAGSVFRAAKRLLESDAPGYWLAQKAVLSLGEIGTPEALECLRVMTLPSWPDVVRWEAAVELGVEEELGFDEETMVG
ncbi:hypothetical protein [Streptomyces alkaliphilus]|uniref:hypothetical protein n=1 Tax=Streptomyces alkaliphilus TaxID=1472722 RepID=UPI001180A11F|nr:hypothetical protein [Streptomyces alkaliphilus]MQS06334.1 hypothetical protein [Streptomyces alkaliphilus]